MKWLRRFGAFWYDFLVGDRPELFIGPIVVLVLAAVLVGMDVAPIVPAAAMVLGVVAVGALSLSLQVRARR